MSGKVIPGLGENTLAGLPDDDDVDRIQKARNRYKERMEKRAQNNKKAVANSKRLRPD